MVCVLPAPFQLIQLCAQSGELPWVHLRIFSYIHPITPLSHFAVQRSILD